MFIFILSCIFFCLICCMPFIFFNSCYHSYGQQFFINGDWVVIVYLDLIVLMSLCLCFFSFEVFDWTIFLYFIVFFELGLLLILFLQY